MAPLRDPLKDSLKKVSATADALKIFPLPPVVLFPGTGLPLHIFEPRYRQLIGDALAGDRVMAMGGLMPGADAADDAPPLSPICCVGTIAHAEPLQDGRYLIVVEGLVRAKVRSELPRRKLYREISAELLEDPPYEGDLEEPVRQAVLELAGHLPEEASSQLLHHAALQRGGMLADIVASAVVTDVARRWALLSELDVAARLAAVHGEVSGVLAQLIGMRPRQLLN